METSTLDINLIASKTDVTPDLVTLSGHLRRVGIGATILSLAFGLFFGVGVTVLRVRVASLTVEKTNLLTRIGSNSRKEGLITVVKKQSGVAQKILISVKPWDTVLDQIAIIAPDPFFTSASVNEKKELSLVVSAPAIPDAAGMVERIQALTSSKVIRNPFLDSLEVGIDGNVKMSITFVPTVVAR